MSIEKGKRDLPKWLNIFIIVCPTVIAVLTLGRSLLTDYFNFEKMKLDFSLKSQSVLIENKKFQENVYDLRLSQIGQDSQSIERLQFIFTTELRLCVSVGKSTDFSQEKY